jgi:YD repeat-containing protein
VTYPNGTTAFYLYDKQNRLTNLTNYRNGFGSDTISLFVYDVGPAGNRRGVEETLEAVGDPSAPAELQRDITYEYDDLYRLTREHVTEDGMTALDVTYVYNNKVGNRDVMIREEDGCRYTTTYSYDANDRLTDSSTRSKPRPSRCSASSIASTPAGREAGRAGQCSALPERRCPPSGCRCSCPRHGDWAGAPGGSSSSPRAWPRSSHR